MGDKRTTSSKSTKLSKTSAGPTTTRRSTIRRRRSLSIGYKMLLILGTALAGCTLGVWSALAFTPSQEPPNPNVAPIPLLEDLPVDEAVMPPVGNSTYAPLYLPFDLTPLYYSLEIRVPFEKASHVGFVSIEVRCNVKTRRIILNLQGYFTITNFSLADGPNVTSVSNDEPYIIATLDAPLEVAATYQILVEFTVRYPSSTKGFYIDNYNGATSLSGVYTTSLKPNGARMVFPCFDGIRFKTPFNISIVRPNSVASISNSQLLKTVKRENLIADMYADTPSMLVSNLAWFISPYKNKTKGKVTIWFPPHQEKATGRLLDIAVHGVHFFSNLFGTTAGVAKLDIASSVRRPSAVESTRGLIVFREHALYGVDDEITVPLLLSAIAQQWLGSLITTKTWTDSWVVVSLPRYLGVLAAEEILPNQNYLSSFLDAAVVSNSKYDGPRDLDMPIKSPTTLFERANQPTAQSVYHARTLHMLLGDSDFKNGIRMFIGNFSGSSANVTDFLGVMDKAQTIPIVQIKLQFEVLVKSHDIPNISVRRFYNGTVLVTKTTYLSSKPYTAPFPIVIRGNPVDLLRPEKPMSVVWVYDRAATFPDTADSQTRVIVNQGVMGMDVLNYDAMNWHLIASALSTDGTKVTDVHTWGKLIRDVFLAYRNKAVSIDRVIAMIASLHAATDLSMWKFALDVFVSIDELVQRMDDPTISAYKSKLMFRVDEPSLQGLPFDKEQKGVSVLARNLMDFLCVFGTEKCRDLATQKWTTMPDKVKNFTTFQEWMADQSSVTPVVMLCMAVRHGNAFQTVMSWLPDAEEYDAGNIEKTLVCSNDQTKLKA
ncbi:glutamyl aminopeptidase-like isoform X2 [Ornithodoros turicata]